MSLAVLGSTNGTDIEAIVAATKSGEINAHIEVVVSNKKDSGILKKAKLTLLTHTMFHIKTKNVVFLI